MTRPLIASAPGSLMLLGEHVVLHGYPCLTAAIDRRVRISIIPRNDGLVTLASDLGDYEGERDALVDHPRFRFVLAALRQFPDALPGGLDAVIQAGMPSTIGFGTSAAVSVACCAALYATNHSGLDRAVILREARAAIRNVQGRGSGADAAASTYGGVVFYRQDDEQPEVITRHAHPLTALYCGYKTPTPEVIARVQELWRDRPEERDHLFRRTGNLVEAGRRAMADDMAFGRVLDQGQELMQTLGVSTPELEDCIVRLRETPGMHGAKISGSGLGDCAIGWGADSTPAPTPRFDPYESFAIHVSAEGVILE